MGFFWKISVNSTQNKRWLCASVVSKRSTGATCIRITWAAYKSTDFWANFRDSELVDLVLHHFPKAQWNYRILLISHHFISSHHSMSFRLGCLDSRSDLLKWPSCQGPGMNPIISTPPPTLSSFHPQLCTLHLCWSCRDTKPKDGAKNRITPTKGQPQALTWRQGSCRTQEVGDVGKSGESGRKRDSQAYPKAAHSDCHTLQWGQVSKPRGGKD